MSGFDKRSFGTSRVTRRNLVGASGVALGGLAFASAGLTTSTAMTEAASAVPLRLSLNENPFGPSPLAIEAIQGALQGIARYAGDDARAFEGQIAEREGVSPDQIILGEILDSLGLQLALNGRAGGEFIYSEPGYTALIDAVAPGGGTAVGVPLNGAFENDLDAIHYGMHRSHVREEAPLSRPTGATAEGEPGPSAKCTPQAALLRNSAKKGASHFFALDPGRPSTRASRSLQGSGKEAPQICACHSPQPGGARQAVDAR
jgi:hypothetical protein